MKKIIYFLLLLSIIFSPCNSYAVREKDLNNAAGWTLDDPNNYVHMQDANDSIGINTSSPRRKLDVRDPNNPALRVTHTDNIDYLEIQVDSDGDATITASGGDISFGNENIITTGTITGAGTSITGDLDLGENDILNGGEIHCDSIYSDANTNVVINEAPIISALTASKPVFTDGSKALTSSGTVPVDQGGTGQTTYTNGQLLIGNTTGNTLAKATLTGTANQITVTNGTGSITLSTPQDINTTSSVNFGPLTLSGKLNLGTETVTIDANTACTLDPNKSTVILICNDITPGCTVTMSESSAVSGDLVCIYNDSNNGCAFSDTPGVSETTGNFTMDRYDSACFQYIVDRWIYMAGKNNNPLH